MKIMTIIGTRPEIIRHSRIIPKLDNLLGIDHILIHTGQNYDYELNQIFFNELRIRKPNKFLNAKGSFGEQIGIILRESEKIMLKYKPDKVLILGDTNTDLSAYIAERLGIPVYHMEAGNRCFDKNVPEEINRRMIDHISTFNFPYVSNSADNLYREGIDKNHVIIIGNPIYEVMKHYEKRINGSNILTDLKLYNTKYFLATFHRAECVNSEKKLREIIVGLENVAKFYKTCVVCSIHPRTRSKLDKWNIQSDYLKFLEPLGFFDFISLEQNAYAILSDSGTVCEEACILKVPHIIMRESTERPETVKCGASMISGINAHNILKCTQLMISSLSNWKIPEGYLDINVSDKMIKFLIQKLTLTEK